MGYRKYFVLLLIAIPLSAQYSFDFVCLSDTFKTGVDYFYYKFRLANTGALPDSYAFDCRVIDSVPGWFELYCAGGQCAEPGVILYSYLIPGAVDTGISISVYTAPSVWGTEIINLLVRSLRNPSLRDSINVYAAMEQAIYQKGRSDYHYTLELIPNPFNNKLTIKLPDSKGIKIKSINIYDATGRLIRVFSDLTDYQSVIVWAGDDNSKSVLPEGCLLYTSDADD
ncbi:MAG: T9SS type A sorting domain-containing protein, partial [Candidatus Sumerlaeia bacterium]|nr:T9SS type A sorting domain-containing protein [Candidatus Sumerlaeia bacterium]